jgi:hypothetical protein
MHLLIRTKGVAKPCTTATFSVSETGDFLIIVATTTFQPIKWPNSKNEGFRQQLIPFDFLKLKLSFDTPTHF